MQLARTAACQPLFNIGNSAGNFPLVTEQDHEVGALRVNLGNPRRVTETQAEKYTEQAKSAADEATERIKDIREQVSRSE